MIAQFFTSTRWLCVLILVAPLVLFAATACGGRSGEELVEETCTRCHTATIIAVSSKTAHEWFNTVQRMKQLGADLEDDEVDALVEYLATQYGP